MRIGYRTLKTAIATPIAITIAQLFGITGVITAGILTILCIQPSRKRSVESALERFLACILGVILAIGFFELLGYSAIVLGILLLLLIPLTLRLKIDKGILTSTVIILNLYAFGKIELHFIYEQLLLIVIGIGVGLIVNLYMPSLDRRLAEKQAELEKNFQKILGEISVYVRDENLEWDGKEITNVEQIAREADELVQRDRENQFLRNGHTYYSYFVMRDKQFTHLQKMLTLVVHLPKKDRISERIANFFERLSNSVHPENTAIIFLEELAVIRTEFKQVPLPTTQIEFETRASLFQLLNELEEYLLIKHNYKKSDVIKKKQKKRRLKKA